MDVWAGILKFAIGTGIAGFVLRSLIGLWITRDVERYKATLATEHSVEVERLKADLRAVAFEHETRFARLHEKRVEVIAELYKKLAVTEEAFRDVLHPIQAGTREDHERRIREAQVDAMDFFDFFNQHRVFLDVPLAKLILTLQDKLRRVSAEFASAFGFGLPTPTADQWKEAGKLFSAEVPSLRNEIETRVREMLGIHSPEVRLSYPPTL